VWYYLWLFVRKVSKIIADTKANSNMFKSSRVTETSRQFAARVPLTPSLSPEGRGAR
jgi:hypothetical protein